MIECSKLIEAIRNVVDLMINFKILEHLVEKIKEVKRIWFCHLRRAPKPFGTQAT